MSNNYEDFRSSIVSGDIVFFSGSDLILPKLIRAVTGSSYSHCAIAFTLNVEDEDRVFVVEQHLGGQRIVNLSTYQFSHTITVLSSPIKWESYSKELLNRTGKIPYSFSDFVSIGIRESVGLKLKNYKGEVCSEMVAKVFISQGVKLSSSLISPGKLFLELTNLGFKLKGVYKKS